MRYPEIFAAIEGVTSPEGPFPVQEVEIDGILRKVFGGIPESLRDYYPLAATHGDKEFLIDRERRLSFADVLRRRGCCAHELVVAR
jgi:hypothetical protein